MLHDLHSIVTLFIIQFGKYRPYFWLVEPVVKVIYAEKNQC